LEIFNVSLFIAEYAETFRRVHLRVTRSGSTFESLQVGNYITQKNSLSGTLPVLKGDIVRIYVSSEGSIRIYTAHNNCWFEERYLG
jgi:CRISPR/Cas system-associated endoribonuclease Cas2